MNPMSAERNGYILVVDDEQDVRDYLESALTDVGFAVKTASW